ncbi:MAG: hypothetical protein LBE02_01045 [Spirochaetaceae bacterium]|nr:hypothetical protein [Spirochaetaceae bacterium]
MKFKGLLIFFNAVMVFFIVMVFIIPFTILGREPALGFWRSSWFLIPLVFVFLAAVDLYFLVNYRIFFLLEKEDWPALVRELEVRVIRQGRYSPRLVRLLLNTYLVLSDARAVSELEKKLAIGKSGLIEHNILIFGTARILTKDYEGAGAFFFDRLPGGPRYKAGPHAEWIRWYYGFSLLLSRRFEEAADVFSAMVRNARDGILTGLSAYFLTNNLAGFLSARAGGLREDAKIGKERVRQSLRRRSDWNREVKRVETEIYVTVLSSYINLAADYVYA